MEHDWDITKYQLEVATEALETLWSHLQDKDVIQGNLRQEHLEQILITLPTKQDLSPLLKALTTKSSFSNIISRISELCQKVAESNKATDHEAALTGIAYLLEKIGTSENLSAEAIHQAEQASRIALRRFLNPTECAIDTALRFVARLFSSPSKKKKPRKRQEE